MSRVIEAYGGVEGSVVVLAQRAISKRECNSGARLKTSQDEASAGDFSHKSQLQLSG